MRRSVSASTDVVLFFSERILCSTREAMGLRFRDNHPPIGDPDGRSGVAPPPTHTQPNYSSSSLRYIAASSAICSAVRSTRSASSGTAMSVEGLDAAIASVGAHASRAS